MRAGAPRDRLANMRPFLLPALFAFATTAQGGEALSLEEFERLVAGKTLHFTEGGAPYGSEQFFAGRRSLWHYAGDAECASGTWRPKGEAICFRYDHLTREICWRIIRDGGAIFAELHGSQDAGRLELGFVDETPLPCPQTGVGT
jgi:hypothetical protein